MNESVDSEAVLRKLAVKLEEKLEAVKGVKEIARLAGALTSVCGELRQHAKGRHRALATFSIGEIIAYLRQLPADERDEAFAIAFQPDASEPLL